MNKQLKKSVSRRVASGLARVSLAAGLVFGANSYKNHLDRRATQRIEILKEFKQQKLGSSNLEFVLKTKLNPKFPHDIVTIRVVEGLSKRTGIAQVKIIDNIRTNISLLDGTTFVIPTNASIETKKVMKEFNSLSRNYQIDLINLAKRK